MKLQDVIAYFRRSGPLQRILFLRTFIIASLSCFVLWQMSLFFDASYERRKRIEATQVAVTEVHHMLRDRIKSYIADMRIAANQASLLRMIAGDKGEYQDVVYAFVTTTIEKPEINSLRYLDRDGMEIVRVDRRAGEVRLVDSAKLQNKANRYYFRQSIILPVGTTYVSPIDLNVEHNAIEMPWNPTLRLATPISGLDGRNAGVVIINITAEDLISSLSMMLSEPGGGYSC